MYSLDLDLDRVVALVVCRLSQLPEADRVRVTFKQKVGPELMWEDQLDIVDVVNDAFVIEVRESLQLSQHLA